MAHRREDSTLLAQCTMCHDPHTQLQNRTWATNSYLFSAASDLAGGVTTTSIKKTGANWSTDQWKGMLVIPNVRYQSFNCRIASNTTDQLFIDTDGTAPDNAINLSYARPGNTFAIVYGRLVKDSIGGLPVRFFRQSGPNSFVDSDATIDGVCQVCHDATTSFSRNGTLEGAGHPPLQAGKNCSLCHEHKGGFKPNCRDCHGYPPITDVLGGPDGLADNEGGTGAVTAGAHEKHASGTGMGYACETCHSNGMPAFSTEAAFYDKEIQIGFIMAGGAFRGGVYDGRTVLSNGYTYSSGNPETSITRNNAMSCSTIYCHSSGQSDSGGPLTAANYATPQWGTAATGACGTCHGATPGVVPPTGGSHPRHAGPPASGNYAFTCTACHSGFTETGENHANGKVNVDIDSQFGSTASSSADGQAVQRGFSNSTCSNTYCHGNGTSRATGVVSASTTSNWGSPALSCTSCHGYPPDYDNGGPKSNSHEIHAFTCEKCHAGTTADGVGISDRTLHVNRTYDLLGGGGVNLTYSFSTAGGSCSNISCHGGGTAQWGGTAPCQDCHGDIADLDDFSGIFYNNGILSRIQLTGQWDLTGHGRPLTSGNYSSGNPPAGFTNSNQCLYCHDNTVRHKTTGNLFRLRNISDADWGRNGVCQTCHASGSAGISVDGVLRNGTRKAGSTHYGSRHTASANGGQFCWDCHDPHGDGNLFMVHAEVAKTSDVVTGAPVSLVTTSFVSFSTGTSYAVSAAPFTGICNVCHTSTDHYTSTSGDGHNASVRCTSCHRHTQTDPGSAFLASCDDCHLSPPTTGKHAVHFGTGTISYGTTAVQSNQAAYGFSCGICHQGTHINTTANPRTVETTFTGIATQDGATTALYTGAGFIVDDPGTGYTFNYSDGSCSNTYCHGNYPGNSSQKGTPTWMGSAVCGSCHGASNTIIPNSGSHTMHTDSGSHNYPCTLCHKNVVSGAGPAAYTISDRSKHVSGFVDWQFDGADPKVSASTLYSITSGSQVPSNGTTPRIYGTCSNTYCHSIAQTATGEPLTGAPGEYATTPRWGTPGTGSNFCGPCHKNGSHHNNGLPSAMDSGSHTKHLGYQFNTSTGSSGPSYKCAICHKYDSSAPFNGCDGCHGYNIIGAVYKSHVNGVVDVIMDAVFGPGTYDDSGTTPGAPGNGFFSCSSTYCHSNGTSVATGSILANTSTVWGSGALACNACHGNPPAYPNGSPKANSHTVDGHAGVSCNKCHVTVTTNGTTITSTSLHVNKAYNVMPELATGVTFTYTYSPTGGTCTNISCHSGGSAKWGVPLP